MKKKHINKSIKILLFSNALVLVSAAMLGPIYAIFVEKVGGDILDASFAFGVQYRGRILHEH
jgi:hypothetical protein